MLENLLIRIYFIGIAFTVMSEPSNTKTLKPGIPTVEIAFTTSWDKKLPRIEQLVTFATSDNDRNPSKSNSEKLSRVNPFSSTIAIANSTMSLSVDALEKFYYHKCFHI